MYSRCRPCVYGETCKCSASGNLGQDNASFYFDDANNRLGLGTTSPGTCLGVAGSGVFNGLVTAPIFSATTTTATSTFSGGVQIGTGTLNISSTGEIFGDTTSPHIDLDNATGAEIGWSDGTNHTHSIYTGGVIQQIVSGTEEGRWNSTGLGIGTTSPSGVLAVQGSSVYLNGLTAASGVGDALCVITGGLVVRDDSPVTVCSGASSKTVKHDISPLTDSLKTILALKPVSYVYNQDYSKDQSTHLGFIVEDVEPLESRLVDIPSTGNLKGLKYAEFVSPIVGAIQEIYEKITGHEKRIAELEREVAELKALLK